MTQHLIFTMVVAPLLLLGMPAWLLRRILGPRWLFAEARAPGVSPTSALDDVKRLLGDRAIYPPLIMLTLWNFAPAGWFEPWISTWQLRHALAFVCARGLWLASGCSPLTVVALPLGRLAPLLMAAP